MSPKVCVSMIVFNGDGVLSQVLESTYPYVSQIVINNGCTQYWQNRGYTGSTDQTVSIIENFPDPDNKITLINVNAPEKTGLCQAIIPYVKEDAEYLWCLDSDEVFKSEHIEKILEVLRDRRPASIAFKSRTFFGGFTHYMTGFERDAGFKRILKYSHGCHYVEHRPPTLSSETGTHIGSEEMWDKYGVEMFHMSYVFPDQVNDKISYYESAVIRKGFCIENYFHGLFIPWCIHKPHRPIIEQKNAGVHEFKFPEARGECYTAPFEGELPEPIRRDLAALQSKIEQQIEKHLIEK